MIIRKRTRGISAAVVLLVGMVVLLVGATVAYLALGSNRNPGVADTMILATTQSSYNSSSVVQQYSSQSTATSGNGSVASSQSTSGNSSSILVQIPVTYTSANSSSGLMLSLSLAGFSNGTLGVSVEESNVRDAFNNVSAAQDWPYSQTALQSSGCYCSNAGILPMGFAVFKGYLTSADYASAQALTVCNSSIPDASCSAGSGAAPTSYGFIPDSDAAAVYDPQLVGQYDMQASASVDGFWSGSSSSAQFTPFPAGNYTVIAGDEWGQLLVLHFGIVTPSGTQPSNESPIPLTASLPTRAAEPLPDPTRG